MSRAAIAAEGMTLEPGQSIRMVCPFCGGGSDGERSMSLKLSDENGLLLYHCFRANCPAAGVIGNTGSVVRTTRQAPAWQPYDCSRFTSDLPDHVLDKLDEWSLPSTFFKYDPDSDRLAMPVYGPLEDLRGYVLRAVDSRRPKVLSARLRNDVPFQHWTRVYRDRIIEAHRVYVVEDIPSAERLRLHSRSAVALLGCTPSDDALDELGAVTRRRSRQELVIALDPDATQAALRMVSKYGMRGRATVRVLPKDIKNMSHLEVEEWLNANS